MNAVAPTPTTITSTIATTITPRDLLTVFYGSLRNREITGLAGMFSAAKVEMPTAYSHSEKRLIARQGA
jgi:hypothetical protein